jgi:hypothetical protein
VTGLFEALESTSTVFTAEVSAYEIFKETISDLLSNSQKRIQLTHDHDPFGLSPSNLQRAGPIRTHEEALGAFKRAWDRRNGTSTDFGPAVDFTSFVFNIDLTITRRAESWKNAQTGTLHSRLMIVELPCTDRLKDDGSVLRLREGSSLNNSLITLKSVTNIMATGDQGAIHFAPHRSALLTQVLHEAIGGNMFMRAIMVVSHGQYSESRQAIGLANDIRKIKNFPVCNDEITLGLLHRYRSEIQKLSSDTSSSALQSNHATDNGQHDQEELQSKLHALEGKVVRTNLDKV